MENKCKKCGKETKGVCLDGVIRCDDCVKKDINNFYLEQAAMIPTPQLLLELRERMSDIELLKEIYPYEVEVSICAMAEVGDQWVTLHSEKRFDKIVLCADQEGKLKC